MEAQDLRELVASAQSRLTESMAAWNGADLARCEESCRLLQLALGTLAEAQARAERMPVQHSGSIKLQLDRLRVDVKSLARLVDASAAFGRGLASCSGADDTLGGTSLPYPATQVEA